MSQSAAAAGIGQLFSPPNPYTQHHAQQSSQKMMTTNYFAPATVGGMYAAQAPPPPPVYSNYYSHALHDFYGNAAATNGVYSTQASNSPGSSAQETTPWKFAPVV